MLRSVFTLIATILAVFALTACGGGSTAGSETGGAGAPAASKVKFPPVEHDAGAVVMRVADEAEGERLCNAAQADAPGSLRGVSQVRFDIPGTGSDVTCMLGSGR